MRKTALDNNSMKFGMDGGTITITAGDVDFQKTLTQVEKDYIHNGMNWISKLSRETDLKTLHSFGYTLDQVNALPEEERDKIWQRASSEWNKKFVELYTSLP